MAQKRVAFLTTGQSPRTDVVPEMVEEIKKPIEVIEAGMLDDLSPAEIVGLRPAAGAPVIVSRLRDGSEVVMDHREVSARLQPLIDANEGADVLVLLCTGSFPTLSARSALVKAGPVVDDQIATLGRSGQRIGVMVPGAAQVRHYHDAASGKVIAAHASPYGRPRWREAVRELADADVIVMHCMGYDRATREHVAGLSGKPTLLSRSLVASAVAELL
ncbi:MAG: AroM family protein [Geminicoccaceae bacterium]